MHIEDYEWVLYLHGDLSEKRESEMEAHLANCDHCLAAYTKVRTGEEIQLESKVPEKKSFWRLSARPRSLRWAALAAIVLMMFIGVSFTPAGRIAWANFQLTLESLGNSLAEVFGVGEDADVITTVDQMSVKKNGVEIKVDQIFIESDQIYFSVLIASDLIDPEHPYQTQISRHTLVVEGETVPYVADTYMSFDVQMTEDTKGGGKLIPVITRVMQAPTGSDYSQQKDVSIKITLDDVSYWEKGFTYPKNITGPWEFEFKVDGTRLAKETRDYPLSVSFNDNEKMYEVQHLSVSPIRTVITVSRVNPIINNVYTDENGEEQIFYSTSINLNGFLIQDQAGNETELTTREYLRSEWKTAVYEFTSDPEKNPYGWLKNAESVKVTPYVTSLNWKSDQKGIRRLKPIEDGAFKIEILEGAQDEN